MTGAKAWHGGDQGLRVVVLRMPKDVPRLPLLYQPALPHHRHAIGDLRHHPEIMGDEQDGGAVAACSSLSRRRICAWVVTSSAVVGSSAMMSAGSSASAIAIITRWR